MAELILLGLLLVAVGEAARGALTWKELNQQSKRYTEPEQWAPEERNFQESMAALAGASEHGRSAAGAAVVRDAPPHSSSESAVEAEEAPRGAEASSAAPKPRGD